MPLLIPPFMTLVEEKLITTATTRVTFTNLSALRDGDYLLSTRLVNTCGSTISDINFYVNSDETKANYGMSISGDGRAPSALTNVAGETVNNECAFSLTYIHFTSLGRFWYIGHQVRHLGTTIKCYEVFCHKLATIADITQLDLVSNITSGISANSKFRLYKFDRMGI